MTNIMSKVSKPNLQMYVPAKDRSEKSTKKSTTSQKKSSSKDDVSAKKKLTKEHSTTKTTNDDDKKKVDKKHSTSTAATKSSAVHPQNDKKQQSTDAKSKSISQKVSSKSEAVKSVKTHSKKEVTPKVAKSIVQNGKAGGATSKNSDVVKKSSKTVTKSNGPLKASHSIVAKHSTDQAKAKISTKNVMNQVHNVTVSSPPPIRREIDQNDEVIENVETIARDKPSERERTRTRTLDESEIVLLKPKSKMSEAMAVTNVKKIETELPVISVAPSIANIEIKQPISFEIILNENGQGKKTASNNVAKHQPSQPNEKEEVEDEEDYEDDFESYESDFETDISSQDENQSTENKTTEPTIDSGESEEDDNVVSTSSKHPFDNRGQSMENSDFDSASFELKVLSARAPKQNIDNGAAINGKTKQAEQQAEIQHDSGIENNSNTFGGNGFVNASPINGQMNSLDLNNKTFDNISDIEPEGGNSLEPSTNANIQSAHPHSAKAVVHATAKMSKRGEEILRKITLDTMNYILFDFKPIPYDVFMKIYGNSNTTQASMQTHNNRIDRECQSDAIKMQTVWTQYPTTFYSQHIVQQDFADYKKGCGLVQLPPNERINEMFSNSLSFLQNVSIGNGSNGDARKQQQQHQMTPTINIDYENLSRFLVESELTLSRILNAQFTNNAKQLRDSFISISCGYFELNIAANASLKQFTVNGMIAINSLPGFLFTLHRDVATQLNVIAIWNIANANSTVCLLSVWSPVVCVEVHTDIKDVVFAGLDDGSIAVWDYSESKYWHPTMHDDSKRFVPSQIVTPLFSNEIAVDSGKCIGIRSLPISSDTQLLNGYNPYQICSLHECGFLTLWTVLGKTPHSKQTEFSAKRIDHQSMWSKIKLVQNKVIDLRQSIGHQLRAQSAKRPNSSASFDKTRSYFESEVFSDAALQELQKIHLDEQKLITGFSCTALELTHKGILIATNENFLLFGRKSFKNESFRRIRIGGEHSARVECMVALYGFDDDIVLTALNNGTVLSYCCEQNAEQFDEMYASSDGEDGSVSSSILSLPPAVKTDKMLPANSNDLLGGGSGGVSGTSSSYGPVQLLSTNYMNDTVSASSAGKSCAIQSLVQSERKFYDEFQTLNHVEFGHNIATANNASVNGMQSSMNSISFVNGQTVMSDVFGVRSTHGDAVNKNIVYLTKANRLVALVNSNLRICDLATNEIVNVTQQELKGNKYISVAATTDDYDREYLILLNLNGIVEVHQIKADLNV